MSDVRRPFRWSQMGGPFTSSSGDQPRCVNRTSDQSARISLKQVEISVLSGAEAPDSCQIVRGRPLRPAHHADWGNNHHLARSLVCSQGRVLGLVQKLQHALDALDLCIRITGRHSDMMCAAQRRMVGRWRTKCGESSKPHLCLIARWCPLRGPNSALRCCPFK